LLAGLIASTIAFFAASYFIKRSMDENDIPKGMTRNLTIFTLAIAVAYGVGWLVDRVAGA
jgi:ABC-type Na+ efflux pump permease subunit